MIRDGPEKINNKGWSRGAGILYRGFRLHVYKTKSQRRRFGMDKLKALIIAALAALMNWMGILAVPVCLMVGCNIIDYITGLCAAKYRSDGGISSYKSIRGITKKVCMWLLVVVGAFVDVLIQYAVSCTNIAVDIPFVVATTVAVWLVVNEMISILENMVDIGVSMPPFLLPVVKHIKKQVEDTAEITNTENDKEDADL